MGLRNILESKLINNLFILIFFNLIYYCAGQYSQYTNNESNKYSNAQQFPQSSLTFTPTPVPNVQVNQETVQVNQVPLNNLNSRDGFDLVPTGPEFHGPPLPLPPLPPPLPPLLPGYGPFYRTGALMMPLAVLFIAGVMMHYYPHQKVTQVYTTSYVPIDYSRRRRRRRRKHKHRTTTKPTTIPSNAAQFEVKTPIGSINLVSNAHDHLLSLLGKRQGIYAPPFVQERHNNSFESNED